MGIIRDWGPFALNLDLWVFLVEAPKPDRNGNRYFLELLRICGGRWHYVRLWHSDPYWEDALKSFHSVARLDLAI